MSMSVPGNSCSCFTTVSVGCNPRVSGECVYYAGTKLIGPGINTGDILDVVINKLNNYIVSSGTGTVTSVGLTMPSAFSVANSPVTIAGTLAVTATGNTSQYIRGDGTLATFPSVPVTSADNGLSLSGSIVELGGALIKNTTITSADPSFRITYSGVSTFAEGAQLDVSTTGSVGIAIRGTTIDGRGVLGVATTGVGVYGTATGSGGIGVFASSPSGSAVFATSNAGLAVEAALVPVSNSTVVPIFSLTRSAQSAGADGIGQSIDFYLHSSASDQFSGRIVSKFTTASDSSRSSQMEIWGVNSTVTQQQFTIKGTGQLQANLYGSGAFTGTATHTLQVDASGNLIEGSVSFPIISTGTAAPSSTPAKVGDIYVDTTNKKLYFAAGNSSSADWIIAN
jgi:hypothetical protein